MGLGPDDRLVGLLDARLVRESVEEVPAHESARKPVGASAIDEALPVGLEGHAEGDLRQQRGACRLRLRLGQARREPDLPRLRTALAGAFLLLRDRRLHRRQRCQGSGDLVPRVERQAQRVVQGRPRNLLIVGPADLLLPHRRQVDAYGEHVGIGGHAGATHRLGAL